MNDLNFLNSAKIIETIKKLELRIGDRFPESGLRKVCANFLDFLKSASVFVAKSQNVG